MHRKISNKKLQDTLNGLYRTYLEEFQNKPGQFFVRRKDPLMFAHRYSGFHDREATAFLSATFAYGNVTSLCRFVESLLWLMGPSPYEFLLQGETSLDVLNAHRPYYRLHKTPEIAGVLRMMSRVYQDHGSLYNVYLESYGHSSTIDLVISNFVRRLYKIHGSPISFLIPDPFAGSPCKRLNLFLRWMVRRDGIDLGLWEKVSPSDLIIPLDTHIGRISYKLGWMSTPSLSWKKALSITDKLRLFDPDDPIRYDFSLCHESISRSQWLKKLTDN